MNSDAETAYIGLGSNVGNRLLYLNEALEILYRTKGITIVKTSPVYETKPVGFTEQPDFLNCAVKIKTTDSPHELLEICLNIEEKLKRVRSIKWGPRTVDLDILFYGNKVIDEENLKIPHPQIQGRGFVLIPLMDIAPDLIHPGLNISIEELYKKFVNETGSAKGIILYEGA